MVSLRGRYCNRGVLNFRRMRVNLLVAGSLESSQMPAHLMYYQYMLLDALTHVTG
jgi:hypothetical protein